VPFKRHALQVAPYATPESRSRCSANSLFIQSITARTQAEWRRSRWTMIQYWAAISRDRRNYPRRATLRRRDRRHPVERRGWHRPGADHPTGVR
jgi:hypothetical protein